MRGRTIIFLLAVLFPPAALHAQAQPVRVYLDCQQFHCDGNFFRQEITFVDYVRSPQDADVHILVSRQQTGGGGHAYTVTFIGAHAFAGARDTLTYFAPQDATDDQVRSGLAHDFKLGLIRFVQNSPQARDIVISYRAAAGDSSARTTAGHDPWDFWVFRAEASTFLNGESHYKDSNIDGNFSANRNTDALKLTFEVEGSYDRSSFDVDSTETVTSTQKSYGIGGGAVKTLGPHWGVGLAAQAQRSTYNNQKLLLQAGVGAEYDIFPYSASARRLLTLKYQMVLDHVRYDEETIFLKLHETVPEHILEAQLESRQPWGSVNVELRGRQYLDDLSRYSLRLSTDLEVRLVKGLSLRLDGSISRVRDQRYLPAAGLTPDEILLRQQALATDYRYFVSAGFSYSFGSIFNNVVNPRFGNGSPDFF